MRKSRAIPKQSRAREMRKRLLDTTVQLLSEGKTPTTKAISETANVSVGTVYRYFDGTGEILSVLLAGTIREIYNDLASAVGAALDLELEASTRSVVARLTASFERHGPVLRAFNESGGDTGLAREVEETLFALAQVIPARHRPDLTPKQLEDLVFVTMGFTASGCMRIALQRPPDADREAMIDVTARMLAAALRPPS